jgi:glycosyltransferase involved in cell wall biosynthesis
MFLSVAMKGHPIAEQFVSQLAISKNTRLLPTVSHNEMADLFRLADIAISPSLHDGTPNTLLEAMACGCFPIAGDIESLREWISNKVNGILFETTSPKSLADAVLEGLENSQIVKKAKEYNYKLIAEKANFEKVMLEAENFYNQVIKG